MDRKTLLEGDEEDTDLQNGGIVTVDVDAAWPHIDERDFCIEQGISYILTCKVSEYKQANEMSE